VFPALSGPVLAWLAIATRLDAEPGASPGPGWPGRWGIPAMVVSAAVAAVLAVSLFLPWTSAVDVNRASRAWASNPSNAFKLLDRARDLNPLSARPDLVAGGIAARLGDRNRMRTSFDRALDRDPRNWYATVMLAALDGVEGDSKAALRGLDRVAELNPREGITAQVRKGITSGHPLTIEQLNRAFLARYCNTLGRELARDGTCR
jgi:tetratricopeptide (TPR) repeat protein